MLFNEIAFMLALQVNAPLNGKLELLAAFLKNINNFCVGQTGEVLLNHALETLN